MESLKYLKTNMNIFFPIVVADSLNQEDREKAMLHLRKSTDVRRLSTVPSGIVPPTLGLPTSQARRLSQLDPSLVRRSSRAVAFANDDFLTTGLTSKGTIIAILFEAI